MCLSVNSFLGCVSLDVGTKIISIFSWVLSILLVFLYGLTALVAPVPHTRTVFYAAITVITLLQFVSACYLISGAYQKKTSYMKPWIWLSWWKSTVLMIIGLLGAALMLFERSTDVETCYMILVYFAYGVILYYCVSVVDSRREQLTREDKSDSSKRLTNPSNPV